MASKGLMSSLKQFYEDRIKCLDFLCFFSNNIPVSFVIVNNTHNVQEVLSNLHWILNDFKIDRGPSTTSRNKELSAIKSDKMASGEKIQSMSPLRHFEDSNRIFDFLLCKSRSCFYNSLFVMYIFR